MLDRHQLQFVDYSALFVLLIIKSLSYAQNKFIMDIAFRCLGNAITILFVQNTTQALAQLSPYLKKKFIKGTQFILNFKDIHNFEFQWYCKPKADLRKYQEDGIKWLEFLVKYNLNGALCDDMVWWPSPCAWPQHFARLQS